MIFASIVIAMSVSYTLLLVVFSRRPAKASSTEAGAAEGATVHGSDLLVVFVVPALNEERVIGATVDRLLSFGTHRHRILIVDDGSDDETAAIASAHGGDEVWVLRRELPDARRGKGAALNAAYRHLRARDEVRSWGADRVVVCVLDADGRLARNALDEVLPLFVDPTLAGVQVGVRMYNRGSSTLARLQDMEFVIFGDVFQRGREPIGSVGLGGNGQFVRLSALDSLGEEPWTDCLTEDLDLGVRLLLEGWHHTHCSTTFVEQQGVTTIRRFVRQRARWFQGHMQAMRLVPAVMRAVRLSVAATVDLVYHLTSPILVLLSSIVTITFLGAVGTLAVQGAPLREAVVPAPVALALTYVLTFGMAPLFTWLYRRREPSAGRLRVLGMAHLYAPYAAMWFLAGWIGATRAVFGRRRWTKTARDLDAVLPAPAGGR